MQHKFEFAAVDLENTFEILSYLSHVGRILGSIDGACHKPLYTPHDRQGQEDIDEVGNEPYARVEYVAAVQGLVGIYEEVVAYGHKPAEDTHGRIHAFLREGEGGYREREYACQRADRQ